VAGFLPRRPGFEPGSSHVGFVVDKEAVGQVFSRVLWILPTIVPQTAHIHNHPGLVQ
jgi:hypothetical protein